MSSNEDKKPPGGEGAPSDEQKSERAPSTEPKPSFAEEAATGILKGLGYSFAVIFVVVALIGTCALIYLADK